MPLAVAIPLILQAMREAPEIYALINTMLQQGRTHLTPDELALCAAADARTGANYQHLFGVPPGR